MKHFAWLLLVVHSLLWTPALRAETRPQYGGTLYVMMRAAPMSLDPADNELDSFARRSLSSLLFDRLVTTDEGGRVKAALAESWQADKGGQRWLFRIRRGVTFHDGTPLTAESAAASLRYANPDWIVTAEMDAVVIELKEPDPELPAKLALSRNVVAKRDSEQGASGSGPFSIVEWQAGKKLRLAADENYWGGRPFLDAIDIEMGRDLHEQMTALELGKTDLIEVAPEQTRHELEKGQRLASSAPLELLALLFTRDTTPDEKLLRAALGLSVERMSIRNVLLQGAGQPTGSVLPTWMSGYGFLFPAAADLTKARQLRGQVHSIPTWTLGYEAGDTLARLIADRIALNARDAGLSLQLTPSMHADIRLVRIPLASTEPWIALQEIGTYAVLPQAMNTSGSVEELHAAERDVLATERMIPLFHLPATYGAASRLKNWSVRTDGSWDVTDAWLESTTP